ncbi:DnaJ domain-containing protein [Candidatus Woesearchaeota archaeon]|nr:DnaJ domain-containing protein [Candidatus Woesearchaeota archaeon]
MDGKKTVEQLIFEYSEDHDFEDKRLKAREILQVSQDCKDIDAINLQFKRLSKQSHPDMPEGSDEKFKQINWAVKTLRKELA